jgi:hypothetical protein
MDVSEYKLAAATPAGAVAEEANRDPGNRSEQFVAVTGPEAEQVSASAMVVAAYGLFWLLAIVFVYLTYRGQARLIGRVAELEARLAEQSNTSKEPTS